MVGATHSGEQHASLNIVMPMHDISHGAIATAKVRPVNPRDDVRQAHRHRTPLLLLSTMKTQNYAGKPNGVEPKTGGGTAAERTTKRLRLDG
jgi:hypothetical protein